MDQFVSVWMKKEKKFQGREFIEIKISTARENSHSQLVITLDLFINLEWYAISYITQLRDKRSKENGQHCNMSEIKGVWFNIVPLSSSYDIVSSIRHQCEHFLNSCARVTNSATIKIVLPRFW